MNRRQIIKLALLTSALTPLEGIAAPFTISPVRTKIIRKIQNTPNPNRLASEPISTEDDEVHIKDYLTKIRHPNRPHKDDILLTKDEFETLGSVIIKFKNIRSLIGHGHFCIIDFDQALRITKNYSKIDEFSHKELDFLEMIFYKDATLYGFMGEKQITNLTNKFDTRDSKKIPYTGNYLFRGDSEHKYESLQKEIGTELVLTSGIRGVTKQFFLFLNKAYRNNGNLSLASRSLAPPGYSYHSNGDFDVGQKGFGGRNFSDDFTSTSVFQQLSQQGYVKYRYTRDNMLGVRYEPWHIKL